MYFFLDRECDRCVENWISTLHFFNLNPTFALSTFSVHNGIHYDLNLDDILTVYIYFVSLDCETTLLTIGVRF